MNEMREALVLIRDRVLAGGFDGISPSDIVNICDAALAEPPRNCDVMPVKDQRERWLSFCHRFKRCYDCPCNRSTPYTACEFMWMNMPYEGGDSK